MKKIAKIAKKTPKILKIGEYCVIILSKKSAKELKKVLIKKDEEKEGELVMPENALYKNSTQLPEKEESVDILNDQRNIEIENTVKNIMQMHSVNLSKPIDIVAFVREFGFVVTSLDLPETEDGFVVVDDEDNNLFGLNSNKVIGVNKNRTVEEQRFIVAHELGHFVLQGQDKTLFAHRENKKGKNQEENDADYFAACILMYKDLFVEIYNFSERITSKLEEKISFLARYFKVPEQSVIRRFTETIAKT